ncbi:MAG: cytochrome b/b6 domain-containing protein [Candidatus Thiodiazotropha sp.]
MQKSTVTRVSVWSRWLRISHWLMGISTLGLISSGYLIAIQAAPANMMQDIHYLLGALLLPGFLIRLYLLLFGKGTDHISDCEPDSHRLMQAWQVAKFYLTLGKAPLPNWFSHNPLWGPIYIGLFFILLLSLTSGYALLNDMQILFGIVMSDLHHLTYLIIAWFSLLHLVAVFTHDLSGTGSDISGMINGHRIFQVPENPSEPETQSVDLTDLMKTLKK